MNECEIAEQKARLDLMFSRGMETHGSKPRYRQTHMLEHDRTIQSTG